MAAEPGRGNAFLFDIKVDREGRKNSARLDVYQRDDSLSFFARGYLGKGVMKGLLTNDSIIVYFPTEGEFYAGRLEHLVNDSCDFDFDLERLLIDIFLKPPVPADSISRALSINVIEDNHRSKEFRLKSSRCGAELNLKYDVVDKRNILRAVEFVTADSAFRFAGERREYRSNIKIPAEKFEIVIPETAARIYP